VSSNRLFYFQGLSFLYYCTYNDTILFRWDSSVTRYVQFECHYFEKLKTLIR